MPTAEEIIAGIPIWKGRIRIEPLSGGITNRNFLVTDTVQRAVVRLGEDIPVHHVSRSNELAASLAAHAAGISPAVLYHGPGVLILDYIEGRTLAPEDIRDPAVLERIVSLIKACHRDIPAHLEGPVADFNAFQIIRDYAKTLQEGESRYCDRLQVLLQSCKALESAAAPFDRVFGHNDLLAANFLDDGKKFWLIDWDYAGFNTPLFDLGGLASNNDVPEDGERALLETYFDAAIDSALWKRYRAMKVASLLRETMWSMVSEIHSTLDFDYAGYTAENMARFEGAFDEFRQM